MNHRSNPDPDDQAAGEPRDAPPGHVDGTLPLPHERDESTGRTSTGQVGSGAAGEAQRRVIERARRDLEEGQVDTDLHGTPGLDAERRDALLNKRR